MKQQFTKTDKILANNHYQKVKKYMKHFQFVVRYQENKANQKNPQKMSFNSYHKKERAKVETAIRDLTNRFQILKKSYRRKKSEPVFEFCHIAGAIHNCVVNNKR
jgi:ATPase subunit of ABC transporter with duplicated ATPase domains